MCLAKVLCQERRRPLGESPVDRPVARHGGNMARTARPCLASDWSGRG